MITKATERVIVEGPVVSRAAPAGEHTVRRRIEISAGTGIIERVGEAEGSGDLLLDDDFLIFPGFIDVHVHAREDITSTESYKECFRTAGEAALHGGVTAFVDMPNNPRPPIDDASYAAKRELARACPVDVLLYAGVGPGTSPLTFPVPYKVYMGPSVGDLFFESMESLRETLARYRGLRVAFHAEDPEILTRSRAESTHARQRPPEAEARAVESAISISEGFRIDPHICHLSTAEGLEVIRAARQRGLKVSCEVAPHHLFYDQDNITSYVKPQFLQANPPIRSRLDRIALLEAFREGEIDYLATDHAPHTPEEKERGTSGLPHLDTFGSFVFWLREEGVSWNVIREACSEKPGRFLSHYLPGRYGRVEPGFVGSLTILRKESHTVRRGALRSRSGWSPFEGCLFGGRVSHTVLHGRIHPQVED